MSDKILATRMNTMQESATLALNARAKKMAADGHVIYNFTAGELSEDTPLFIQEAVRPTLHKNKYSPASGMTELRERIAEESRSFYGLEWIATENVVVTAGAKPALYATFLALINPGDEVIVPTPAWVSYLHLIELVGGKVVTVPLRESYDLDADQIAAAITNKTKAILLNSPHNPTGALFSKIELDKLAKQLESTSIHIISDDIYSKLVYEEKFLLVPKAGFKHVIIINGFSKSQALTGWRIGYVIAPTSIAHAIGKLLSHITGNASLPAQEAALAVVSKHDLPPLKTMQLLKTQRSLVMKELSGIPGLKLHEPGGAFYFYLDLRAFTKNSTQLCESLLQATGVALVPGEAFLTPGYARLTFSVDASMLKAGLKKLRTYLERVT